jgi:hypothetical protein
MNTSLSFYYYYSALEIAGLRVPVRYIRDFPMFNVCCVTKNCPSARCASAAKVVCRNVDVFGPKTLLLKHILYWISYTIIIIFIIINSIFTINIIIDIVIITNIWNLFFAVTLWLYLCAFVCLLIHAHFVIGLELLS